MLRRALENGIQRAGTRRRVVPSWRFVLYQQGVGTVMRMHQSAMRQTCPWPALLGVQPIRTLPLVTCMRSAVG